MSSAPDSEDPSLSLPIERVVREDAAVSIDGHFTTTQDPSVYDNVVASDGPRSDATTDGYAVAELRSDVDAAVQGQTRPEDLSTGAEIATGVTDVDGDPETTVLDSSLSFDPVKGIVFT